MSCRIESYYSLLFFACILGGQARIVYLNGTEVAEESLKIVNSTASQPAQKWFNVFDPRNISNHSADKTKNELFDLKMKNEEEQRDKSTINAGEEEKDQVSNSTLATRDTTVLSSIRGIWSDLTPIITIMSAFLGIFLVLVIIQSPLSPLPVPPLPYPPMGPFPPTNMYPFGVPPVRNHHIKYAGPPTRGGNRTPRNMESTNETEEMENMIEKVVGSITPSRDFFDPKEITWAKQLAPSVDALFIKLRTAVGTKGSDLLEEIAEPSNEEL